MITLKTLAEASAQSVFDQIVNHLRQQGCKSGRPEDERDDKWASDFICMYRGTNGTKCAAGCLIGDDEYKPEMEGIVWGGGILSPFNKEELHSELIRSLQEIHDWKDIETWEEWFEAIANDNDLIYTPLTETISS